MEDDPYSGADLESVLKTLSSLAPQSNSNLTKSAGPSGGTRSAESNTNFSHSPRQVPPNTSKPASTPTVDPSTITTWSAALRHVMRTIGQDEEIQLRIRGLIRSQHNHERQWWKGREALVQKQQARGEKKKELDAVLSSIGAPVDSKDASSVQEDRAEIQNYDAKVYRASVQMAEALTAELRGLRVPFFVLQRSMIKDSSVAEGISSKSDGTHLDVGPKLTRLELVDLQRRMLELLQDLCKE
ncbi:hypothetical protein N7492_003684 [Penicillium capsulatum]|uniref:Uncharacterized protein n=1 Tax=Penicillium capsulatum TaxID=69766 RepID=A0A9W9LX67_9EURO|nr:hypothetical protein N7492_003684 [Penicillium capsulatum]KAJ6121735.1 hypothetical protein N7512_004200 [Penicillium capsulatum]